MEHSRRQFMIGCSSAIAALAGSRVVNVTWGEPTTAPSAAGHDDRMLVVIFLRGGMDGLNFLAPANDPNYIAARPQELRLVDSGDKAALPVGNGPAGLDFRLHPKAARLKELYDAKHLAFVHACGLTDGTRSHFEAMAMMERGASHAAGDRSNGWLSRYLGDSTPATSKKSLLPAVSGTLGVPQSLLGFGEAMPVPSVNEFRFHGTKEQRAALFKLYSGDHPFQAAGLRTLRALELVQSKVVKNRDGDALPYTPEHGADYGNDDNEIGRSLKAVAQLIKMDLGMRVATIDFGGWDTHQGQAYYFNEQMGHLSTALAAFHNDVSRYHDRLNVVVMSEFGRRLKSNQSQGTDHGHGNVMMVLGGGVQGGKIYGQWPGLATEQLDSRADLAVTTDFRAVLAEVMTSRFDVQQAKSMFPGLADSPPLGIFHGT
ncbi:DUF1501 domain-containing protein [soil metagenome]